MFPINLCKVNKEVHNWTDQKVLSQVLPRSLSSKMQLQTLVTGKAQETCLPSSNDERQFSKVGKCIVINDNPLANVHSPFYSLTELA